MLVRAEKKTADHDIVRAKASVGNRTSERLLIAFKRFRWSVRVVEPFSTLKVLAARATGGGTRYRRTAPPTVGTDAPRMRKERGESEILSSWVGVMGVPDESPETLAAEKPGAGISGRLTARSGAFIGSVNLLARGIDRVAALAQIVLIAAVFGASPKADLYFLAGVGPLTIGTIVGEPLGRAFLGLLVRPRDRERGAALASAGLVLSLGLLGALTLAYLGVAYILVRTLTPTGTGSFGPWLVFAAVGPALGVTIYLSGVLLWLEHYVAAAIQFPLASLAGLILLGVATALGDRVVWAAAAIAGGYAVAVGVFLAKVARSLGTGWVFQADRPALEEALTVRKQLLSPVAGGLLGGQAIVMLERMLAATLGPGAVSTLAYARGIAGAPATISQAVGAGVYPGMVRAESVGSTEYLRNSFLIGLRVNVYLGAAFAVYLALFGTSVSAFLLQRGAFTAGSVDRAGDALTAFALSTFATSLLMYLVPVLYGIGSFRGVLYRSLTVFGLYITFAPLLLVFLGEVGLALGFSIAQTGGAILAAMLVAGWLGLLRGASFVVALWPVIPRLAVLAGVLGLYRLMLATVDAPVEWRGALHVGVSALLLIGVGAAALLSSSLPEARRLRQLGHSVLRGPTRRFARRGRL